MQPRRFRIHRFAFIASAMLINFFAHAEQVVPNGVYEAKGSGGTVVVETDKDGRKRFNIGTLGANGHICSLSGEIDGLTGEAREEDPTPESPVCKIDFTITKRGISVKPKNYEECSMFCGARASFDGKYFLPPKGCNYEERKGRRELFFSAYQSRQYATAFTYLNSMYMQCKDYLHWVEIDDIRNDLAITQFHQGKKAACLAVMREAIGSVYTDEEKLKEHLPPIDFDTYLRVAQATWFNTRKCGGRK